MVMIDIDLGDKTSIFYLIIGCSYKDSICSNICYNIESIDYNVFVRKWWKEVNMEEERL